MADTPKDRLNLKDRLTTSAFAFRGYNVTNHGRSLELLNHPVFGPTVERHLRDAGQVASDSTHEHIDLIATVRNQGESNLETFAADISTIVAMELAQLEILREFFGIDWLKGKLAFGYSLGEVAALIGSGVYEMRHIVPAPVAMARECAELGADVTMGVVFSRGPELDVDAVRRLCLEINAEGDGVIAISSYLSPNTVLVLGQGSTVERFQRRMHELMPKQVHLRKNSHRWPPLHTPILWEKRLVNRAAYDMHTMPGGFIKPPIPIVSLVTGKVSYNDYNSREILNRWIDHPQRLWDAVCETLSSGVETVVHVGPEPNLILATFKRLSDNVEVQLKGRSLNSFGLRAMSRVARRPWLTKMLSSRAALLRAPFIEHIVLEDWLLEQPIP